MRNRAVLASIIVIILIGAGVGIYFFFILGKSPKIVTFVGQPRSVLQDADALAAPEDGAGIVARLSKGMSVDVSGVIDGQKWMQITLPDKRIAYVPVKSLGIGQPNATQPTEHKNVDDGPPVEFDTASEVYTVTKSVTVYLEPNIHAPQRYQIDIGTNIPVVARSKDGMWARASTEDGQPAFLLVADLGEPQHGKAVVVPLDDASEDPANLPDTIDGTAKVVTTASVDVAGHRVPLAGIVGDDGSASVQQFQAFIDAQGGTLDCVRQDHGYLCKLPIGIDIALNALYNGLARPTDDAPAAYQNQAKSAQSAGRGLWH